MRTLILIAIAFFGAHVSADMDCNRLKEDINRLIDDGVIRDSTYLSLFKSLIGPAGWKSERAKFHVNQDKLNERHSFLATKRMNEETCLVMGKGIIDDLHYYLEFIKKSIESMPLGDLNNKAHNKIHFFEEIIKAWRGVKILSPRHVSAPKIKHLPKEEEQRSNALTVSVYLKDLKDELERHEREIWVDRTGHHAIVRDNIKKVIVPMISSLLRDIESALEKRGEEWFLAADAKKWRNEWRNIKKDHFDIMLNPTYYPAEEERLILLGWISLVEDYLLYRG